MSVTKWLTFSAFTPHFYHKGLNENAKCLPYNTTALRKAFTMGELIIKKNDLKSNGM